MPVLAPIPGPDQIEPVVRKLAPDVVRVVLRDAPDWSGDPAIYVRVILSDESVKEDRLGEVTSRVRKTISDELRLDDLDRIPYFKFRTASEQARLREQSWE
jgi:hypothetical protein